MWVIIFIVALAALIYFTGIKPTTYWKDRGIPSLKPWPYVGNLIEVVFQRRALAYVVDDTYRAFPEKRYCGFYNLGVPSLMLRDPELIKKIMVKEFETFPQHRPFIPEDTDPLWSKNLFVIQEKEKWQNLRSTLSPSFTSSKMKMMFELMKDCSKKFSDYFLKQNGLVTLEVKDAFSRFTCDIIASTVFGVTCDSLGNKTNKFYEMGKNLSNSPAIRGIVFLINAASPTISKMLKIPIFNSEVASFFRRLILETIQLREEKGIFRPDMIQLLMEVRKGRLKPEDQNSKLIDTGFATAQESQIVKHQNKQKLELTDEDITAQALVFFFGGFDTVSTMLCFACYELALHPDIQETLHREIDESASKCQGDFTYEALMKIKYLDMVVTEILRKWPPFIYIERQSIRPFTVEPENADEKPLYLPTNSICVIPVYSIQRDPKYYPNPDKFDPERFNDVNKININPFAYLPFGAGPRNCIGSRFALLEAKVILAEIVMTFEIVPVAKTQIPIQVSKKNVLPTPDEGVWLGLKPRK